MSNETPATCATQGHCMHPDDTTDTCMRCGAVDGWIKHEGDVCPVDPETMVYIRVDNIEGKVPNLARVFRWYKHAGITHYRLAAPVVHPEAGLDPAVVGNLNIKMTVKDEHGTYSFEDWQKKHAKPSEPTYEEKLRDKAALAALSGLLSGQYDDAGAYNLDDLPEEAWKIANAFMAARKAGV